MSDKICLEKIIINKRFNYLTHTLFSIFIMNFSPNNNLSCTLILILSNRNPLYLVDIPYIGRVRENYHTRHVIIFLKENTKICHT